MNRRGFLTAMLAAGMAPAIVKAASLMPVRQLSSGLLVPDLSEEALEEAIIQIQAMRDPLFVVPEEVNCLWVTIIAGGGPGRSPMVSPCEDADGNVFMKPISVKPGQVIPVTAGKSTTFQWISDGVGQQTLLNSQVFM